MYGFILFLSQHSPSFSRHNFRSFPFFFPRFCQVSQTVRRLCAANCHQGNDLGSFLPYYYAVPWYWESIWSVEVWMGDSKEKKMLTCGCCEGIKEGAGGWQWVRKERKIHHLSNSGGRAATSWQRHPDCGQRLSQRGEVCQSTRHVTSQI